MRNFWKKLTASLLALVLTVQLLPVSALADEFEIDDERHDTFTYEQPDVSGEISELRGEYEKHFSLSDGTYSAVVYPYPVHYDSNGTWQETYIIYNTRPQENPAALCYVNFKLCDESTCWLRII